MLLKVFQSVELSAPVVVTPANAKDTACPDRLNPLAVPIETSPELVPDKLAANMLLLKFLTPANVWPVVLTPPGCVPSAGCMLSTCVVGSMLNPPELGVEPKVPIVTGVPEPVEEIVIVLEPSMIDIPVPATSVKAPAIPSKDVTPPPEPPEACGG